MKVLRWQEASLESSKGFYRGSRLALQAARALYPEIMKNNKNSWKSMKIDGNLWKTMKIIPYWSCLPLATRFHRYSEAPWSRIKRNAQLSLQGSTSYPKMSSLVFFQTSHLACGTKLLSSSLAEDWKATSGSRTFGSLETRFSLPGLPKKQNRNLDRRSCQR